MILSFIGTSSLRLPIMTDGWCSDCWQVCHNVPEDVSLLNCDEYLLHCTRFEVSQLSSSKERLENSHHSSGHSSEHEKWSGPKLSALNWTVEHQPVRLKKWQTPLTFLKQCSHYCIAPWRCQRWYGDFGAIVVVLMLFTSWCYCFLLSIEEDIQIFSCYVNHLLALKSSNQLLKCFTCSTLFGSHSVRTSSTILFQRHTAM